MNSNNWRPSQSDPHPPQIDRSDWRSQLQSESRQRIVNKIMGTLETHLPFSAEEGRLELEEIAIRFEEKIYNAATSQANYLRGISLKMLTMESRFQSTLPNAMPSNSAGVGRNPQDPVSSQNLQSQVHNQSQSVPQQPPQSYPHPPQIDGADWRSQLQPESRQRIVNKIMETLKRHLPFSGEEGLQELKQIAIRFEEKIHSAAINQSDYLRKISLKMLTMEPNSQSTVPNAMPSNSAGSAHSQNLPSEVHSQSQSVTQEMRPNQSEAH